MSKVSGSYESVVLGVSEQVPQDRRSGQHFEQVNMVSDPVKGLARRHGSIMRDEVVMGNYDAPMYDSLVADTAKHKEFTFFVAGVEYSLLYRTGASTTPEIDVTGFAWCLNKDTKKFVPIVTDPTDAPMNQLRSGGVSAVANVGKYIYLAGNTIVPTYQTENRWDNAVNKSKLVAWVRGGQFSRTFSVTLTKGDGTKVVGEYKTKPAAYPELLDTSDILTGNPDYQKLVNDRTNLYNSHVTAYIGEAAEDITPQNIATKIAEDLTSKGVTCTVISSTVTIDDADFVEIEGEDGGDGTLLRAVGNEITNLDLVSTIHWVGKVVKVRAKREGGEDAFYLEAIPKNEGDTGFAEVTWRETAGYSMLPLIAFIQGTITNGTLYLASTAAILEGLDGGEHPVYKANSVGDDITSPLPTFFGRRIDYLGVFQDRLVIGSGAAILHSRTGDYFNWFRRSSLTVEETDPFEMYALGSEDDTIKSSTTYDRNVLLFGDRKQYTINGRQKLIPQTASIVVVSSHEGATQANPQNSGNFVFYGQSRNGTSSMHQIQTGLIAESPESYEVSQQLEKYLKGSPVQIVPMTAPNMVLLRTDTYRQGLYTYSYLDTAAGGERIFDSWSRWEWDNSLGSIVGVASKNGAIFVVTLRHGENAAGVPTIYAVCDEFSTDSGLSERPYLDSLRLAEDDQGFLNENSAAPSFVAFGNATLYRFLGTDYADRAEFLGEYPEGDLGDLWAGVGYTATVTPTNPYLRDRNNKALVSGRLTLGKLDISVADTGGFDCDVATANATKRVARFNGRIIGQLVNQVSRQPIVTTSIGIPVGREVRECKYTLYSRTWLPLTITAIEWTGQSLNNSRRV